MFESAKEEANGSTNSRAADGKFQKEGISMGKLNVSI